MNDFLGYMRYDPVYRGAHHDELTFSMIYNYSERFLLSFSHDEVVHGKGTLVSKMPGEYEQKLANLRLAFGYLTAHPGKKLVFMGQDFAQDMEWNEKQELDWKALEASSACTDEGIHEELCCSCIGPVRLFTGKTSGPRWI